MTLAQFHGQYAHSPIKVMSGYNGKVLARRYDPEKHQQFSEREVISIWSELYTKDSGGWSQSIYPILCVHVNGREEYMQERFKGGIT